MGGVLSTRSAPTLSGWQVGLAASSIGLLGATWAAFRYLPHAVVRHRFKLLTSMDNEEGVETLEVPNKDINSNGFNALYKSKSARGRSEGAGLSDLFWYFLSPGPEIHPEQAEDGPKYDAINLVTHRVLAIERTNLEAMLTKYASRQVSSVSGLQVVRLRDWYMKLFGAFLHEMIFGDEASEEVLAMIVRHATNVIETLKWTELRDMDARLKVYNYCLDRVRKGSLPDGILEGVNRELLPDNEIALLLSNAFFNTGVVQSSEAMMHASLALAQNPEAEQHMASPDVPLEYCKGFVNESFRLWPLFGIAHRITTADIVLPRDSGAKAGSVVKKGTVVCFNYPKYHSEGYDEPHKLLPERWYTLKTSKQNFCPFGSVFNRPCPAQSLSTRYMLHLVPYFAARLDFESPVLHTRSLPGAGLCVVSLKSECSKVSTQRRRILQFVLWATEEIKIVVRSVVQFRCGSITVADATKLQLCKRYYASGEQPLPADQQFSKCPVLRCKDLLMGTHDETTPESLDDGCMSLQRSFKA